MCLSANLFYEARGESPIGRSWVGHVTFNRVKSSEYPNDFCEVITERFAYTWTHQVELPHSYSLWGIDIQQKYKNNKIELQAWEEILKEVTYFYLNKESLEDTTDGSICYMTFSEYLRRDFIPHCPRTEYYGSIDNHVFFTPIKR